MTAKFDRDAKAKFYAIRHKEIDPGILKIFYLPTGAPPNEIRLVEVTNSIMGTGSPEPIDFGVDSGSPSEHKLIVLDVPPEYWESIQEGKTILPGGWSFEGAVRLDNSRKRKKP
jgi:hypothetical protein